MGLFCALNNPAKQSRSKELVQAADRLRTGLEEELHIWLTPGFKKTGEKLHGCKWQEKRHENQIPSVVLSKKRKKKKALSV